MPWLEWLDRQHTVEQVDQVKYRLLEPVAKLSHGDPDNQNLLIQGDNLDALKALLPYYGGQVKCVYVDPPFNTGAAFENYDDNTEVSTWLSLMYQRLSLLHDLLRGDGCIFVHLDDNQADNCRVMLDEIFGRKNFMGRITVAARSPSAFSTVNPGVFKAAEYILWYAKRKKSFTDFGGRVPRQVDYAYNKWLVNPDESHTKWRWIPIEEAYAKIPPPRSRHPKSIIKHFDAFIVNNADRVCRTASISDTGAGAEIVALKQQSLAHPGSIFKLERTHGLDNVYVKDGEQILFYAKNVQEVDGKQQATALLTNIWTDIAWEGIAKEGAVSFKKGKKPERLIKRCLELATEPGDLVLDSFLGSGTTAAVAHKMGRHWIGIEMGEQARTHCQPRLRKVVEGEQSGISVAVGWKGGGGFRFFKLGPTVFDENDQIRHDIPYAHLAAHVWFIETGEPRRTRAKDETPFLGIHEGTAYYLLYNGILGDKRVHGGNVLTLKLLSELPAHDGPKVIYGEATRLSEERLASLGVVFKQIPYELKAA